MMKPIDTGWFGHAEPFAFDMGEMRYASDMWRMVEARPRFPHCILRWPGWEIVAGLSHDAVRAKSLRQTTMLRGLAEQRGFKINTPHDDAACGGTICFDFAGSDEVAKQLNRERFFCDWRPGCGIRASPHFYTTDEEVLRFVEAVDRIEQHADVHVPLKGKRAWFAGLAVLAQKPEWGIRRRRLRHQTPIHLSRVSRRAPLRLHLPQRGPRTRRADEEPSSRWPRPERLHRPERTRPLLQALLVHQPKGDVPLFRTRTLRKRGTSPFMGRGLR